MALGAARYSSSALCGGRQQQQHPPRPRAAAAGAAAPRRPRRGVLPASADARAATPSLEAPAGKVSGKVVCVGEALFDLIADQKGVPRDKVRSWTPYAGGAPCNVATSLARLGLDVTFATALGDDARGDALVALCEERGVKLHAVRRLAGRPTRDVYVTRDEQGDREFAGFGLPSEQYADAHMEADELPYGDIVPGSVLVTGTLGLAYPATASALRAAVGAAARAGATVLVDVNWRPVFWSDPQAAKPIILDYLQSAHLLKWSDADLEALLGLRLATALINPALVLDRFPACRGVLITAGAEGAAYAFRRQGGGEVTGVVPAFEVGVTDTTGAGDAFTAGFIYKLFEAGGLDGLTANPRKLKEAVVFASAAGASTCTRAGAIEGQPDLGRVMDLYERSAGWYNFW